MANPKKKSGKAKPGKGPGKKPNPQVGVPPAVVEDRGTEAATLVMLPFSKVELLLYSVASAITACGTMMPSCCQCAPVAVLTMQFWRLWLNQSTHLDNCHLHAPTFKCCTQHQHVLHGHRIHPMQPPQSPLHYRIGCTGPSSSGLCGV